MIKKSITISLLALPLLAYAQGYPDMKQPNMQELQKMMMCMNSVDQAQLQILEEQQQKLLEEVKSLCQQGKRKLAEQKVITNGREMMENPAVKQIRKCGEMASNLLPEMPFMDQEEQDGTHEHVCDSLE